MKRQREHRMQALVMRDEVDNSTFTSWRCACGEWSIARSPERDARSQFRRHVSGTPDYSGVIE